MYIVAFSVWCEFFVLFYLSFVLLSVDSSSSFSSAELRRTDEAPPSASTRNTGSAASGPIDVVAVAAE